MNILFMSIAYPSPGENNLYSDLMQEFCSQGHEVYVLCSCERRHHRPTQYEIEDGVRVLRIRTGNITKTNLIEKGIATLLLEYQYIRAIRDYFPSVRFDLLIYSTPPITFEKPVVYLKKRDHCVSYLLLKDIFPQNAVDMGFLKPTGLIYRYFRNKEKRLYRNSDWIGCMSPANVRYVLEHNPEVDAAKVHVSPNSIKPRNLQRSFAERNKICETFAIPEEAVIFLYGGNLGKPQGLDFLLQSLTYFRDRADVFFLIVGSGTEYTKIAAVLSRENYKNVKLVDRMPKRRYNAVLANSDVGLVFLDPRFTIPNFPSRLTAYMEAGLPILAATDVVSDIRECLQEAKCGIWLRSGDFTGFLAAVDQLAREQQTRNAMGAAGRAYLETEFTVSRSVAIITSHGMNEKGD